mgnify:CR=1 FL=1
MAEGNNDLKQAEELKGEDASNDASSSALRANTAAMGDAAFSGEEAFDGCDSDTATTVAKSNSKKSLPLIVCAVLLVFALCGVAVATSFGVLGSDDSSSASSTEENAAAAQQGASESSSGEDSDDADSDEESSSEEVTDQSDENQGQAGESSDGRAAVDDGGSSSAAFSAAAGDSSGVSESSFVSQPSQEPQQLGQASAQQPATITVSVYVDSSRAAAVSSRYPSCMASTSVTLSQGATVYDALCATGVGVSGSSYYVSAINGLAEKLSGYPKSGWMYSVNGVFPNYACGRYVLQGGESIYWGYTLDLGNDL